MTRAITCRAGFPLERDERAGRKVGTSAERRRAAVTDDDGLVDALRRRPARRTRSRRRLARREAWRSRTRLRVFSGTTSAVVVARITWIAAPAAGPSTVSVGVRDDPLPDASPGRVEDEPDRAAQTALQIVPCERRSQNARTGIPRGRRTPRSGGPRSPIGHRWVDTLDRHERTRARSELHGAEGAPERQLALDPRRPGRRRP